MADQVPYIYKAKVTKVVDGDTVDLDIDVGFKLTTAQRVRLLGVNTPELHSQDPDERAKADRARRFTEIKLLGKDVLIKSEKDDAFGRWLAILYLDGEEFNTKLLDANLAVPYERRKAKATESRA